MLNTRLMAGAVLLAALGTGAAACTPGATTPSGSGPAQPSMIASPTQGTTGGMAAGTGSGSGSGSAVTTASGLGNQGITTGPGAYLLSPMPVGTVSLTRDDRGHLAAHVRMFGLTPGSSHTVDIEGPAARWAARFPALTADTTGQADTTLTSTGRVTALPRFSRFAIRLGSDGSALAAEPIAESGWLPRHPRGWTTAFQPVTANLGGVITGQPHGQATISYDATAQALTITVSATGLNPGPHAAHIHDGSCASQGPVAYMMPDFIADAAGTIDHQTRVVTGVASVPGPGHWYLNLHMGGMNQILANGAPTLSFRPLLCTNVTSVAGVAGMGAAATMTPTPAATPSMTGPATPSMPSMSGTPSSTAVPGLPAGSASPVPSADPTTPVSYPTHF